MPLTDPRQAEAYPTLSAYSDPVRAAERAIVGREKEIEQMMAAMRRPELSNVLLLAPAGSGKSALVQGAMLKDESRLYLEVDLARMVAGARDSDAMAGDLKRLFDEAESFVLQENQQLVIFMDEIHQVVQLSPAAVEALKPVLAASGVRGLRIIAATTHEEFNLHMAANLPLVERFQQIKLDPADKATTVQILRGYARRYEVERFFPDDRLFELIYDWTDRYVPASVQPRQSIRVLDAMMGWHLNSGRRLDKDLLADVLLESTGQNVVYRVDAVRIREQLDAKVYSQKLATASVARRLEICVADLQDKTRPASSFLFTGGSGVGKTELVKQMANLLFGDSSLNLIRFDMSEYANDDMLNTFRYELTQRVAAVGRGVILLDEIEKASGKIVRLLLQLLDDGRLTDQHGRQVSFLTCYVVMTTNAASEIYRTVAHYNPDDDGSGRELLKRMTEIRRSLASTSGDNKFPPELLGRIDTIVPFQPLSRETQSKIVMSKLAGVRRELMAKHGVRMAVDERVLAYLIEDQASLDSDAGGARGIISVMTDKVVAEVAAFVNRHEHEKAIRVDIEGTLRSEDKELLESDARVVVSADR